MLRRPLHRLATTLFVVLSLLFSQLALANYACPERASQEHGMAAMDMPSGAPCESMGMAMDDAQPMLCHQHCTNAPQNSDPMQVPAVSLPAVLWVLVVPVVLDGGNDASLAFAQAGSERPPPDSLFLATLRLRV